MKNKIKFFLILFLIIISVSGWKKFNLKNAFDAVKTVKKLIPISVAEEKEIGRVIAANIVSRYGLYENEIYTGYLNYLGKALAYVNNPSSDYDYNFYVLNSGEETAFAVPGGFIFVTKGMLGKINDEATLAFVLLHEISHIENRDAIKQIQNQKILNVAADEALKNKGADFRSAVGALENLMYKGFSRSIELERDADALIMMRKLGYSTEKTAALFEGFEGDGVFEGLNSTHPDYKARVENIQKYSAAGIFNAERYLKEVSTSN